jgi:hypothetical protein
MLQSLKRQDVEKQGEIFPGKSGKDCKRRGAKASQGFESSEDTDNKFCFVCVKLKCLPDEVAKTHNAQDCRHLAKFNKQLEGVIEVENTPLIRTSKRKLCWSEVKLAEVFYRSDSSESISKCTISVLRRSATLHTSVSNSTANISANVVTSAVQATCITCYGTILTWQQRSDGS